MRYTRAEKWENDLRPGHACVVRYGGFGDVIQATSIFPLLKEQGYKLTFNCHPSGADLVRGNPYVDEVLVQDPDYIPGEELGEYWEKMEKSFDRLVNLTQSVERTLLAWPGDKSYFTEGAPARHARMNVNYLEHVHDMAGVRHEFHARFWPTDKEVRWAKMTRLKMAGQRPLVLLSLSGSSVHKAYPHWDAVIAWLMLNTDAVVVTVGDALCRVLEGGWQRERRVKLRSGAWSIRETLTMAEHASLVVGTETGVLNSVGLRPVPKVLMLSHSSVENLSKYWVNTTNLVPFMCQCHPCHKMHYNTSTCRRPPEQPQSKAAWCAWSIDPERVQSAIADALQLEIAA